MTRILLGTELSPIFLSGGEGGGASCCVEAGCDTVKKHVPRVRLVLITSAKVGEVKFFSEPHTYWY